MDINTYKDKKKIGFKVAWQLSIVFIILISSHDVISSFYALTSERMSGLYSMSNDSARISTNIILEIDSIQISRSGIGFKWPVSIKETYRFKSFPSLELYLLEDGETITDSDGNELAKRYELVIFNSLNNHFYIFGDSSDLFSAMLGNIIDPSLSDTTLIDLITLYYNSDYNGGSFYLMNSIEDFNNLFSNNRIHQPTSYAYTAKDRVDDTNTASNIIKPAQIERHNNYSIVRLNYWDAVTGNLLFCEFAILKGNIILLNQEIKASILGPYFQDPLLSPKHPLWENINR